MYYLAKFNQYILGAFDHRGLAIKALEDYAKTHSGCYEVLLSRNYYLNHNINYFGCKYEMCLEYIINEPGINDIIYVEEKKATYPFTVDKTKYNKPNKFYYFLSI